MNYCLLLRGKVFEGWMLSDGNCELSCPISSSHMLVTDNLQSQEFVVIGFLFFSVIPASMRYLTPGLLLGCFIRCHGGLWRSYNFALAMRRIPSPYDGDGLVLLPCFRGVLNA